MSIRTMFALATHVGWLFDDGRLKSAALLRHRIWNDGGPIRVSSSDAYDPN